MATSVITLIPTSRTNLGPLITTFTQPNGCNVAVGAGPTSDIFRQAQFCNGSVGANDASSCWPSITATNPKAASFLGYGFYSPGLYCPSGYTTACKAANLDDGSPSSVSQARLSYLFQFGLLAGETAVGCCPSGYACYAGGFSAQTCIRTASSTTVTGVLCDNQGSSVLHYFTVPSTGFSVIGTTRTTSFTVATATLYAPLVQINHRNTDLPSSLRISSTPSPPLTTTWSEPSQITTTTASTVSRAAPVVETSSSGFGICAKVGISVAVPVAALAVLGGIIWWAIRRKRAKTSKPSRNSDEHVMLPYRDGPPAAEIEGRSTAKSSFVAKSPMEAPTADEIHELDATPVAHEMEGVYSAHHQRFVED